MLICQKGCRFSQGEVALVRSKGLIRVCSSSVTVVGFNLALHTKLRLALVA